MKILRILYGALAILGAVSLLLVLGGVAFWVFSPKPETNFGAVPRVPPVATREIAGQVVHGVEEEVWVIRTKNDVLRMPAKYVGPYDLQLGFFHLFVFWPGLDPAIKHPGGGRTTRDIVDIHMYVERKSPPRPSAEVLAEYSKRYGEPRPAPGIPGMLEYARQGRVRDFLAVDVSPPSLELQPFHVMCSLDHKCRSYINDFRNGRLLVDFYPEHLPNAQKIFRDVFGLLGSLYGPAAVSQPAQ